MARWFFSLGRHFSRSLLFLLDPSTSLGEATAAKGGQKTLVSAEPGRQERDGRLNPYRWDIDHEESAILLASCWIVKYLCKIAR